MTIISHPGELMANGALCLAIGMFDGVHLGHQQVIRQAVVDAEQEEGQSVVVTFDRHPATVVAPERAPALIYPLQQKLETIQSLGVDSAWVIPFDQEFSRISGEMFVRRLVRDWPRIRSISVGGALPLATSEAAMWL